MAALAHRFVNEIGSSAPRFAARLGHVLTRAGRIRYAEQRDLLDRTGFGGMI